MSRESKYIPMPEAQTERLMTKSTLPFGAEESIGLNVKHIQNLCQVSGFRHLTIKNQEKPEVSSIVNMIVGVDGQGGAVSGGGATKKAPTFEHEFKSRPGERFAYKNTKWPDLTISLNTKEMKQRILTSNESVKNAEIWAMELNEALVKGIVNAGLSHLLKIFEAPDLFMSTMILVISTVGYGVSTSLGSNFVKVAYHGLEDFKEGSGTRLSYLSGVEIERSIVLLALANTQKLAKKVV